VVSLKCRSRYHRADSKGILFHQQIVRLSILNSQLPNAHFPNFLIASGFQRNFHGPLLLRLGSHPT
jgi:hypothetical protein